MAWYGHGEARIYYEESGAGEPVLILPGWGGSIDELTALREALAPTFRVIAADVPGSGKSGPQPRTYTHHLPRTPDYRRTRLPGQSCLVADMAQAIPRGEFLEAKGAGHAVHRDQPAWLTETVVRRLPNH